MPTQSTRVLPILAPVTLVGLAVMIAAGSSLASGSTTAIELLGILALIAGATLAEAFPVPIELEGLAAGGVSLAAVFIVGAAVVYGWAPAVLVAFVSLALIQMTQRRGLDRLLYNGAVYAIGGAVAAIGGGRLVARAGRWVVVAGLVLSIVGVLATAYVATVVDGSVLGWAIALPQLVAGAGSGLAISPNQTLTLSQVPVEGGGSAAGVVQTGQRIGTALGIAAVGAVFFARLADGGDYVSALVVALLVCAALMAVALAVGLSDLWLGRRARRLPPATRPVPPG